MAHDDPAVPGDHLAPVDAQPARRRQLERGEAKIFYEAKSETINIVARQSLQGSYGD